MKIFVLAALVAIVSTRAESGDPCSVGGDSLCGDIADTKLCCGLAFGGRMCTTNLCKEFSDPATNPVPNLVFCHYGNATLRSINLEIT